MALQKRVSAPGKARRAAKKKPRHTKAQKTAAKAAKAKKPVAKKTRAKRAESKKEFAPKKSVAQKKYAEKKFLDRKRSESESAERTFERSEKRRSEKRGTEKRIIQKRSSERRGSEAREFDTRGGDKKYSQKRPFKRASDRTERGERTYSERKPYEKKSASRGSFEKKPYEKKRFDKPAKRETSRRVTVHREPVRNIEQESFFDSKPLQKFEEAPVQSSGKSFRDLGIPAPLANALYVQGITAPFPIQEATLPDALAGKDILGRGQTGSGKTLAFSLALLTRIASKKAVAHHPLALILTPTRELAQQIDEVLRPLAREVGHESVVIAGGLAYGKQINAMRKRTAILVATPGRLIDLLNKGEVILDDLEIAVLDEADQMADMGFLPVVKEILDQAKPDGQRMLFSATLDRDVDSLVKQYLKDPKVHSLHSEKSAVATMEHYILVMQSHDKEEILAEMASRHGKTIIFVKTQRGADRVADKLMHAGVPAGALHGGKSQAVRTRMLKTFKDSPDSVLVATDVAARGIHVDGISLVVHADPAQSHKDYLHRSGRTARAGESGTVVSIAPVRQRKSIASLVARAGVTATQVDVSSLSPELVRITGARKPSGIPYIPPKEEKPKSSGGRRGGPSRSQGRGRGRR